jgi:hypothetical protein
MLFSHHHFLDSLNKGLQNALGDHDPLVGLKTQKVMCLTVHGVDKTLLILLLVIFHHGLFHKHLRVQTTEFVKCATSRGVQSFSKTRKLLLSRI